MKAYWNSLQTSLEQLEQTVTRALIQLHPDEQSSKVYDRFHSARMSHTRLKALEGTGHRQGSMDKLREDAADGAAAHRWCSDSDSDIESASESNSTESHQTPEEKRKQQMWRAQQRQSQTRLAAWVTTLSPEELELNEREGKRLEGAAWELPKVHS